jgi:hypothetical protein
MTFSLSTSEGAIVRQLQLGLEQIKAALCFNIETVFAEKSSRLTVFIKMHIKSIVFAFGGIVYQADAEAK